MKMKKKIVYSHNNKKVQSLQFIFYHNYRHVLYENKTIFLIIMV